jgi:hypothetical protein
MHIELVRRTQAVALLGALAATTAWSSPASAASTYSARFRTAVRQLPVAAENNAGYDRNKYVGTWADADRDCHNTRQEVLAQESTVRVGYSSSSHGCTVSTGAWRSFYDNKAYTSPTQLQIDHMVPVAEAWGSGARSWTQARRVSFYNDLGVAYALNAMPNAMNQAKSASGPESWMPPANRCRYVEIWTAMKIRWRLSADSNERAALIKYADGCPNNMITVNRV